MQQCASCSALHVADIWRASVSAAPRCPTLKADLFQSRRAQVVHADMKSKNVLLNGALHAKISDVRTAGRPSVAGPTAHADAGKLSRWGPSLQVTNCRIS